jgi:hypothetical protein
MHVNAVIRMILQCYKLFVVLTNKNGGVTITQTNVFIVPLTTPFAPGWPS